MIATDSLCRDCGKNPPAPSRLLCAACLDDRDAEALAQALAELDARRNNRRRARTLARRFRRDLRKNAPEAFAFPTTGQVIVACCLMISVVLGLAVGLSKYGPEHSREIARAEEAMDAAGIVQVAGPRGNLE